MTAFLRTALVFLAFVASAHASVASAQNAGETTLQEAIAAGDKRYVLLVGVGDYEEPVPDLRFLQKNLDAVQTMMEEVFFVPEANIRRVVDPTMVDLFRTFGVQPGKPGNFGGLTIAEPDAELFVYFIGHGTRDTREGRNGEDAEGFLLAANSDPNPDVLRFTAYSYDTLIANLDAFQEAVFPQGRVVLFMESCFSGQTNDGPVNATLGPMIDPPVGLDPPQVEHGVVAFAAAGADTPAYWDEASEIGLFTEALVDGLSGRADDGDGVLTLEELGAFLAERVPARARALGKSLQRPQVNGKAAGALVSFPPERRNVMTADTDLFLMEFEVRDLMYRLEDAGERDMAALREIRRDIDALMDSCGDACRPLLPDIIPLRDTASARLARCEAAAVIAERSIAEGRFDRLERFSEVCAPAEDVARCVAARDAGSRACGCVIDPSGEGCGVDPVAACAAALDEAAEAARAAASLAPLDAFRESAAAACVAREADRIESARQAVCEATRPAGDDAAVPEGLAACGWAVALAERRAREEECARRWDSARAGRIGDLAAFIEARSGCAERVAAEAELERRIRDVLDTAADAATAAERARTAEALREIVASAGSVLSEPSLRRIRETIEMVERTDCPVALAEAERGGPAALQRFTQERSDCPAEVAEARALFEEARCAAAWDKVNRKNPLDLFRFQRTHEACARERERATRALDTLALDCLYDAQSGLAADLRSIDKAIEGVEACSRRFAPMAPGFSDRADDRLAALRAMREAQEELDRERARPSPPTVEPAPPSPPRGNPAPGGTHVAFYQGIDFYGSDILGPIDSGSAMDCARRCERNGRCRAFTFNTRAKKCFLKWNKGDVRPHPDALSGTLFDRSAGGPERLSPGTGGILYNRDFQGGDIMEATVNNTSLAGCKAACDRNPRCAAFSYIERMRQCWIKHTAGRSRPKAGVHSGLSSVAPSRVAPIN